MSTHLWPVTSRMGDTPITADRFDIRERNSLIRTDWLANLARKLSQEAVVKWTSSLVFFAIALLIRL